MASLQFTEEDIKRSTLLEPGTWYHVELKEYEEKAAKTDGSTNFVFTAVTFGSSNPEHNGVPLRISFSEKAPGFAIPFLGACGVKVEKGKQYNLASCKGKKIDVFVEHNLVNGKMMNQVADYREYKV